MTIDKYILDDNILNVYRYGSVVYETTDSFSDEDYIIITKDKIDTNNDNIQSYTIEEFNQLYTECAISILECVFLPKEHILKEEYTIPKQEINLEALRVSISTIVSNSWVKSKKKLIIEEDYDKRTALKSIFHSLRILDLGIQLARYNTIKYYTSFNEVLEDAKELGKLYEREELWNQLNLKFKIRYNNLKTEFKLVTPMEKDRVSTDDASKMRSMTDILLDNDSYAQRRLNVDMYQGIKANNGMLDTGHKDLDNKIKGFSDLPFKALEQVTIRLSESKIENGGKYKRDNHLKSIKNTDLIDSIIRHCISYLEGEDIDKGTSTSHFTAIAINALMLEDQRLNNTLIENRLSKIYNGKDI